MKTRAKTKYQVNQLFWSMSAHVVVKTDLTKSEAENYIKQQIKDNPNYRYQIKKQ